MLKTKMCKFFLNGLCVVGEACRFAHSHDELKEAAHVQQERLPEWEHRRREFLGLGQGTGVPQLAASPDPELTAAATRALVQGTMATTLQQQQQQPHLSLIPPMPPVPQKLQLHSLLDRQQLQLMEPLEHADLPELPELAIPLPPRPWGGRGQSSLSHPRSLTWDDQHDTSHNASSWNSDSSPRFDASHAHMASNSTGAPDSLDDQENLNSDDVDSRNLSNGEVNAISVSGTGRVLIPPVSLDADVCQDVDIADAELVMARARGAWAFAGIGAVIVLQTKRLAQARSKRIAIDIEDLTELGTHCGTCELRRAATEDAPRSPFLGPLGGRLDHITQSLGGNDQLPICHRGRTRSAPSDHFLPCAVCPRSSNGGPCAACNCGLRIVQKNTFLTLEDEEDSDTESDGALQGARRRTRSL